MSTQGYSDPIDHALSFVAKHHADPIGYGPTTTNQPANVGLLLARFGCDEPTIVSGILHGVVRDRVGAQREAMVAKINSKFGPAVGRSVAEAAEPWVDPEGRARAWRPAKQAFLVELLEADPRALDVVAAVEIHWCGSSLTLVRRLGPEYLPAPAQVTLADIAWWHGSLTEVLAGRADWRRRDMLEQLRAMSAAILRASRES